MLVACDMRQSGWVQILCGNEKPHKIDMLREFVGA
jgi:hypothetical protein